MSVVMDVAAVGYLLAGAVGGVVVLIMQAFAKWFPRRPTDTGRE
jgi:preprotein translocase subunit Sss1